MTNVRIHETDWIIDDGTKYAYLLQFSFFHEIMGVRFGYTYVKVRE